MHSFQDHPDDLHGENGKKCPDEDSFKTIHQNTGKSVFQDHPMMDLEMTLLSRPWVKMTKNQLLSRPLQIELKNLTLDTWSLFMRQVKTFQILSPERRHNQSQNSCPVVHHLQDQDSTPSTWSQHQCPSTVPEIFKHCSPTASTALETCRVSTTSRQTQLSHQSSTEGGKFPLSTKRRSRRS